MAYNVNANPISNFTETQAQFLSAVKVKENRLKISTLKMEFEPEVAARIVNIKERMTGQPLSHVRLDGHDIKILQGVQAQMEKGIQAQFRNEVQEKFKKGQGFIVIRDQGVIKQPSDITPDVLTRVVARLKDELEPKKKKVIDVSSNPYRAKYMLCYKHAVHAPLQTFELTRDILKGYCLTDRHTGVKIETGNLDELISKISKAGFEPAYMEELEASPQAQSISNIMQGMSEENKIEGLEDSEQARVAIETDRYPPCAMLITKSTSYPNQLAITYKFSSALAAYTGTKSQSCLLVFSQDGVSFTLKLGNGITSEQGPYTNMFDLKRGLLAWNQQLDKVVSK